MIRQSEAILIVYFAYAIVVAYWRAMSRTVFVRVLVTNAAVMTAYALLIRLPIVRDWAVLALTILCYEEMGWLAPERHSYVLERRWIVWDRRFLHDWRMKAAIERFRFIPVILELSYMLVYVVPVAGLAALYVYGRGVESDRYLSQFLLSTLLSYALFPFFPSEPPRTVFPGEDTPKIHSVLRRFNLWILGRTGIHTSVFPSAHVSGAFGVAFAILRVLPDHPVVGWSMVGVASSIALATVYGRYHYLTDAIAGIAVSLVALAAVVLAE